MAALAGCTVGPDFHPPAAPTQSHYLAHTPLTQTHPATDAATGAAPQLVHGAPLQRDWYRLYRNPDLNALIKQALAGNPTSDAARQRLAAAREAVNMVYGGRYPSLGLSASVARQRATGVVLGVQQPNFANTFNLFTGEISAAYNLDIFGELTRRIENKQALAAVARDQLLNSQATLVNNIIATALAEAGARTTRDALQSIIKQQGKTLKLVKAQERYGTALRSDVLRAQTQLAETRALIPDYNQQIAVARHRMAILIGKPPSAYHGPKFTLDDFSLPHTLPLTLPSTLVAQRPDVLMAQDLLHAASAQVGVATAETLPRIQLTASYGRDALKLNQLNGPLAEMFTLGAGLTAPIFEGGTLRAHQRQAVDQLNAATADYKTTVLKAFDQVADAMRALDNDADRLSARAQARKTAQASAKLTRQQYRAGAADQLANYLAQISVRRATIAYAKARLARLADTATLMRSLGGGWWPRPPADDKANDTADDTDEAPAPPIVAQTATTTSTQAATP